MNVSSNFDGSQDQGSIPHWLQLEDAIKREFEKVTNGRKRRIHHDKFYAAIRNSLDFPVTNEMIKKKYQKYIEELVTDECENIGERIRFAFLSKLDMRSSFGFLSKIGRLGKVIIGRDGHLRYFVPFTFGTRKYKKYGQRPTNQKRPTHRSNFKSESLKDWFPQGFEEETVELFEDWKRGMEGGMAQTPLSSNELCPGFHKQKPSMSSYSDEKAPSGPKLLNLMPIARARPKRSLTAHAFLFFIRRCFVNMKSQNSIFIKFLDDIQTKWDKNKTHLIQKTLFADHVYCILKNMFKIVVTHVILLNDYATGLEDFIVAKNLLEEINRVVCILKTFSTKCVALESVIGKYLRFYTGKEVLMACLVPQMFGPIFGFYLQS